jgi:hypothetical protein
MNKTHCTMTRLTEKQNDFAYWQTQPPQARLAALESLRNEYNRWKYGAEQRLQRVYRMIKP